MINRRAFTKLAAVVPFGAWLTAKFSVPVKAATVKIADCSRCGAKAAVTMRVIRPTGMTWFTPSNSDFTLLPPLESVCSNCLTDNEIIRERAVGDVVLFATSVLLEGPRYNNEAEKRIEAAIDTVRAYFMVRTNDPDEESTKRRQRATVIRLLEANR